MQMASAAIHSRIMLPELPTKNWWDYMNHPKYRIIAYLLFCPLICIVFIHFLFFFHFSSHFHSQFILIYWRDIPSPFYSFHMSFSFTVSCYGQKCLVYGLCGNEVLQYVCFPTWIGSCVVFVIPCITVSLPSLAKGDIMGHTITRVAASLTGSLNSRSKHCYWSWIWGFPTPKVKHNSATTDGMPMGCKLEEGEKKRKRERRRTVVGRRDESRVEHYAAVLISWQWPLRVSRCVFASHTVPLHWQLQQHIWLPITTREHSSLGPRAREIAWRKKRGKTWKGIWNMLCETKHHLESLLILPQQRQRYQTEALKFMGLTESQEPPLAIYPATWEIMVYITWIWKNTPSQLPATPKFEA